MILTSDQQNALDRIAEWMKEPADINPMFYFGGYAGTGKTTITQQFINGLPKEPMCLAPTGKAASVLQKRLDNAIVTTIHSALYKPVEPDVTKLEELKRKLEGDPKAAAIIEQIKIEKERIAKLKLRFVENEGCAILPGQLVIVDEASMVSSKMQDDLLNTGAKLLFVGDPGQLPPVNDPGYFTTTRPDAMLTQVVRQASDNPIVALSMAIRNGRLPQRISNDKIQYRDRSSFDIKELAQYDQVLTGSNRVRRKINRIMRKALGRGDSVMPVEGEKLICLKNQHKYDEYLINGVQCLATSDADVNNIGEWCMDILYEGTPMDKVPFYDYPFAVHYRQDAEEEPWQFRRGLVELDYAYAITTHKSQGSEWPKVVLADDWLFAQDREFRKRWLYTAVTRAKEQLMWIDMDE